MIGLMRVKNEARWIQRCVESILPVCDQVLIMDDHSTDDTREICAKLPGVTVFTSPFRGLSETRDKNYLLDKVRRLNPDWVLMIDGDEMLAPGAVENIRAAALTPKMSFALQVLYLWDSEDHVRMDGIYSRFWRPSMFRVTQHRFVPTNAAAGFHCGNAPIWHQARSQHLPGAPLLHFGYLHREDRVRKFHWYRGIDGKNALEDGYTHMILGDLPEYPASMVRRHGGPLKVEALCVATDT